MGTNNSKLLIKYFNDQFAKRPNQRKKYENIVYDYLYNNFKFMTQTELYDFYLVDYNLYIELDEEHHFKSDQSTSREKVGTSDNEKIIKCINKPASLLRLSWFVVNNGNFVKIIQTCLSTLKNGFVYLSSKELYGNHVMLENINPKIIKYINV